MAELRRRMLMGGGGGNFPDGATAYFPFTSDFRDVIGGNVGTALNGTPVITSGGVWGGNALYLDGASALTIPYADSLNFDTKCTVEMWINLLGRSAYRSSPIVAVYGNVPRSGSITRGIALVFRSYNTSEAPWYGLQYGTGSAERIASMANNPPTNQWSHLSLNKDGDTIHLYINGTLSYTGSLTMATATNDFLIGKSRDTKDFLMAYINGLLVVRGQVLRTENFTPPAEPYI